MVLFRYRVCVPSIFIVILCLAIVSVERVSGKKQSKDDKKQSSGTAAGTGPKILRADGQNMEMPSDMPTQQQQYVKVSHRMSATIIKLSYDMKLFIGTICKIYGRS